MKNFIAILLTLSIVSGNVQGKQESACGKAIPDRDWAFLVYMVPGGSLDSWADKNMAAMAAGCISDKVTVCVNRHDDLTTSKRYVIQNGAALRVPGKTYAGDFGQDIIQSMQWMVKNYAAKNYGLICWGHGFGPLDPVQYDAATGDWLAEPDLGAPKNCMNGVCAVKSLKWPTRALLLHAPSQTYLSNAQLSSMLVSIKNDVLGGANLGILGADCCRCAALEIAYTARNAADVLIGSQNCELPDGWNYQDFLKNLSVNSGQGSNGVAQLIVSTYNDYYAARTELNSYTLSAINLAKIDAFVAALSQLVSICQDVASRNAGVADALAAARGAGLNMCDMPSYTDIGVLLKNFVAELKLRSDSVDAPIIGLLRSVLGNVQTRLVPCIIANATGSAFAVARGLSIYYPFSHIDTSYASNTFAQETNWVSFLERFYAPSTPA